MNDRRLLIVDDDTGYAEFVREVAEGEGFEVAALHESSGFIAIFRSFRPTLLLLDLNLPGHDGIELLRQLAEEKCTAAIALSSGVDRRTLLATGRLGESYGLRVVATMEKPVELERLEKLFRAQNPVAYRPTETELSDAIDAGQIIVHYQPKIDLLGARPGLVGGVEALARWDHPRHGLIPPMRFIPLAEQTGLIDRLTWSVLLSATQQLQDWSADGLKLSVAVNLAMPLLNDLDLPDKIQDLLRARDLASDRLLLEVTESGAMADVTRTMDIMVRLRIKGIGVSLDDFGTGYSSLVQLYRMPFSELKIDKSFVANLGRDDEARAIVQMSADLARSLGLTICAEGVETRSALDILREMNCDKAQGFLFSPPVEPARLPALARNSAGWNQ